jgi:hypothetical protein
MAFAPVDHTDPVACDSAMAAFHGLYVGVSLTEDADRLFGEGRPWTVADGQQADPNDAHCIVKVGSDGQQSDAWVTWGALQESTRAWTAACLDEAWVIVTSEDEAAMLDLAALVADISPLGGNGGESAPTATPTRTASRRPRPPHRTPPKRVSPGPTRAPASEPTPPPRPTPGPRFLQAEVRDEQGNSRLHAFLPGQRHELSIWIGPREQRIVSDRAFRDKDVQFDQPFGAYLDVEVISDSPAGTVRVSRPMILPERGPSSSIDVDIEVPLDARVVRATVLVFQRSTLLQSAQLSGPVSVRDRPQDGRRIELTVNAEVTPDTAPANAEVDASLSFHVGRPGEVLLVDAGQEHRLLVVGSLDSFRDEIVGLLNASLDRDDVEEASPGSVQQVELLRGLARQGFTFYQVLEEQLRGFQLGKRIQLISAEDDMVPLEFVYDYGFPSKGARLCAHWRRALTTGSCACRPRTGSVHTVCPLGFWGLRFIIERQVASPQSGAGDPSPGQIRPGHETLPPLNRVLFTASRRVDQVRPGERELTRQVLMDHLGDGFLEATSWKAWRKAVKAQHPGVLLSLPHTGQIGHLVALEIGTNSMQEVAALTQDDVAPIGTEVGPVVLLLGCSTAVTEIPWQSAAAAFRRQGASLVVGTLIATLGRQTGPLARAFAELMWGDEGVKGETIGALLQSLRRQMVASGTTIGMSLIAFGQSGWMVPEREQG